MSVRRVRHIDKNKVYLKIIVKIKRSDNSEHQINSHLSRARFIKFLLRKGLPTDDNLKPYF